MDTIVPIVLCGGSGTRLWPLSRHSYPKQFLPLLSDSASLLQQAIQRIPAHFEPAIIVSNEDHRFLVAEQLRSLQYTAESILLEPEGKNTAPAIALAALKALDAHRDPVLAVLAADHHIDDNKIFTDTLHIAVEAARQNKLVTLGITPTHAETGYGYIRQGEASNAWCDVAEFVEKPAKEVAQDYVDSGKYLWNSGIFIFKASSYLSELQIHRKDIYDACVEAMNHTQHDLDFTRIDHALFSKIPAESVDYAVMEPTQNAVVVPFNSTWSDVGSWASVWELGEKDAANNVTTGDVSCLHSSNNLIVSQKRLVATLGVENLAIIDTEDAVLVADRRQSQQLKQLVSQLKQAHGKQLNEHRTIYRPWGHYSQLQEGERYQVKRITVNAGQKLSLQMHHHRAEHWIVVSGTAKVTCGEKSFLLGENESTYIPLGVKHRLENPGQIPLEVIEVQSGTYLGEDDIVRFEDTYGRDNSQSE